MAETACGRQLGCINLLVPYLSVERSVIWHCLREIKQEENEVIG